MDTGFTWMRHREHGGYWQAPDAVLDEMRDKGWEPAEAPEEPNPPVAERIAWERAQQAARADADQPEHAGEADTDQPTQAARRGTSSESE